MIGLARFAEQHREAIEFDLLCKSGHELDDVGDALSYGALASFLHHLGPDSALALEERPDNAAWATAYKTNVILADIFDLLSQINTNLVVIGGGKRPQEIARYPRPGEKRPENKFGFRASGTADGFQNWLNEKRREHGKRD